MLIYYNYVFIYIISSVTHSLNLKVWKGNKCAAGKNFQILLFKLRIDARWNNLPLRNIPRPNRPTPPPPSPLKMKIFWPLPKIQNFQIPTLPPNSRGGGGGGGGPGEGVVRTMSPLFPHAE